MQRIDPSIALIDLLLYPNGPNGSFNNFEGLLGVK